MAGADEIGGIGATAHHSGVPDPAIQPLPAGPILGVARGRVLPAGAIGALAPAA